jgi:hypothetical protein
MAESTRPPAPTSNLALSPLKALRICREVYIEADQPFPKAKIPATKAAYTAQFARISSPQLRRWFYAFFHLWRLPESTLPIPGESADRYFAGFDVGDINRTPRLPW